MATYVEQAPARENSGMGFLMGAIILAVVLFLLFFYGLPLLRNATTQPQINVPGTIDVNMNQPGTGGNTGGGQTPQAPAQPGQ